MALPALPSGWENYNPLQKIDWFNANQVDEGTLRNYASQADIDWMKGQGYQGSYEPVSILNSLASDPVVDQGVGQDTVVGGLGASVPVEDKSAAYQYATDAGGIGLDAMNQNIQDFFCSLAYRGGYSSGHG